MKHIALGCVFALFLALAGFSPGFSPGCSPSESDPPEEKQPVPEPVSLQIQWVTQAQFAGFYVALDKGWYQAEGIDLTIYPGGPDIVPVDLVAGGTRDFGTTLLTDLVVAIQKGKRAVGIAQIQQDNGLRLLAGKSSGIAHPTDFLGKKVGVWLGGWEMQFNALLAQHAISMDQLTVVSQGFSMKPFIEGRLDVASAMIYNEYHMVLAQGVSPSDITVIDFADYGLDFPGDTLFTSRKMAEEQPDLCRRMVRASLKGWRYVIDHPEEATDVILKFDKAGIQDRDHQLWMTREIIKLITAGDDPVGHADAEMLDKMIGMLHRYKVLEAPVSPDVLFAGQFLE